MQLSLEELHILKKLFDIEVTLENIKEYLPEEIYIFLKEKNDLKTIIDKFIYRPKAKNRPYDTILITKFLTPSFNLQKVLKETCENITQNFLIFIDFHCIFDTSKISNEQIKNGFKLQRGSKFSHINDQIKIFDRNDVSKLINQFKKLQTYELMNAIFLHHKQLYDFNATSGIRPNCILSALIHIQLVP